MRHALFLTCLFAFCFSAFSGRDLPLPKTGSRALTHDEKFSQVLQRIQSFDATALNHIRERLELARLLEANSILPGWTHFLPARLILHVDFDRNDAPMVWAQKYMQLGLLVRDMHQDLPINTVLGLHAPTEEPITDDLRHLLVALCFGQAAHYTRLMDEPSVASRASDYWASIAQLEAWAAFHRAQAGPSQLRQFLTDFIHAEATLIEAEKHETPAFHEALARVRDSLMRTASRYLTPLAVLVLFQLIEKPSPSSKLLI